MLERIFPGQSLPYPDTVEKTDGVHGFFYRAGPVVVVVPAMGCILAQPFRSDLVECDVGIIFLNLIQDPFSPEPSAMC